MAGKKCLIYLRVSTDSQARKQLPIDTQRGACIELAERRGYKLDPATDIYVDSESGRKIEGRHALQLLLERCKNEPDIGAVVIYDISRLSRNTMEYFAIKRGFDKAGIALVSVNEQLPEDDSASGWLMELMLSGFAEFRSRQDGEKIRNSMRNKVLGGGWCGLAHYGYKNVQENTSSNKSKRWIERNEKEAPWVVRIHTLFATGKYTMRELAAQMDKEGMPARNGGKIQISLVERVLKDETYIGIITWGGVRNENGKHERLVPTHVFQRNQAILAGRNAGACRKRKHTFVLRSLGMMCGECGARWTAGYHKGRSGKIYGNYSCTKKIGTKPVPCNQPTARIDTLEAEFEKLFEQVQLPDGMVQDIRTRIKAILARDSATTDQLYTNLQTRIENVRQREKKLLEKYIDDKVDEVLYEETKQELEKQRTTLTDQLKKVEKGTQNTQKLIELALSLANSCYRAYQKAPSIELKVLLAQTFFEEVVVRDGHLYNVKLKEPFYFLVEDKVRTVPEFKLAYDGGSGGIEPTCKHVHSYASTRSRSFQCFRLLCYETNKIHNNRVSPSFDVQRYAETLIPSESENITPQPTYRTSAGEMSLRLVRKRSS